MSVEKIECPQCYAGIDDLQFLGEKSTDNWQEMIDINRQWRCEKCNCLFMVSYVLERIWLIEKGEEKSSEQKAI